MTASDVALVLGMVLAAESMFISVPQAWRTYRTRDISALSLTSCTAFVASWALWLGLAIHLRSWPQVGSEIVGLCMQLLLLGLIVQTLSAQQGRSAAIVGLGRAMATVAPTVAFACLVAAITGSVGYAVALAALEACYFIPQVRALLIAETLHGISVATNVLRLSVGLGWIIYGLLIGHLEAAGFAFTYVAFAVFSLVWLWRDRRGVRRPWGEQPSSGEAQGPISPTPATLSA